MSSPRHEASSANIFLVVLSSAKSTRLSIGVMMNGIEPRPAAVGAHFDTTAGKPTLLATAKRADLTIILMTPPGIATDARPMCVEKIRVKFSKLLRRESRGMQDCLTLP